MTGPITSHIVCGLPAVPHTKRIPKLIWQCSPGENMQTLRFPNVTNMHFCGTGLVHCGLALRSYRQTDGRECASIQGNRLYWKRCTNRCGIRQRHSCLALRRAAHFRGDVCRVLHKIVNLISTQRLIYYLNGFAGWMRSARVGYRRRVERGWLWHAVQLWVLCSLGAWNAVYAFVAIWKCPRPESC